MLCCGKVLPDIVKEDSDEARTKRVHMLDFIALLVAMAQHQQRYIEALEMRFAERFAQQERTYEDPHKSFERAAEATVDPGKEVRA